MTRDSIPRDDLYGELEVSRQASVAAIEAAYRRLVKQHHPDVARSDDVERIKRLNLAREWLTDLDRRRRYDVSRGMSPTSVNAHGGRPSSPAAGPTSTEPVRSFGVNANEVRIFLASLRGLDSERARRVFDGRAVAHAKGYTAAQRLAAQVGQSRRKTEWQLAREAASVIARGKLGDTTLTEQVVDVLADTAGAIAIRDLLTKSDYRTLMLPWTWKSARAVPTKSAASATAPATPTSRAKATAAAAAAAAATPGGATAAATSSPAAAPPRSEQPTRRVSISDLGTSPWQPVPEPEPGPGDTASLLARAVPALSMSAGSAPLRPVAARPGPERPMRRTANPAAPVAVPRAIRAPSWLPAAMAMVVFVVVAGALLGIGRPPSEQRVAGITDSPTGETTDATSLVVAPGTSIGRATTPPAGSDSGGETAGPSATEPPGGPGGGTTKPPDPTPRPTPRPTKPPPPAPTPTPPPPTSDPDCTVPNLIGTPASKAEKRWVEAGFTGAVSFWPVPPPNYTIGWQSLLAETLAPCTSELLVQRDPP